MDKTKRLYPTVLLLLAIAFLLIGLQLLYVNGIVRDEYNVIGGSVFTIIVPWIAPLAAIQAVLLSLFLCNTNRQEKGQNKWLLHLVILCLALSMASIVYTKVSHEKWKTIQSDYMNSIQLSEIGKMQYGKGIRILYVLRQDCSACTKLTPKLKEMSREESIEIWCYNTSQDRDDNADEMYRTLASFQIDEVPYILIWDNEEVSARFYGEKILDSFTDYYQKNRDKFKLHS